MKGIIEDPSVEGESAGFGCAVANRFGQLLDDEGADPFDIIRVAQVEKQKKKKEKKEEVKKPAAVAEKPVKKDSQKDRRVPVSAGIGDNSQPTKSLQGNKYPPRGGSASEGGERRVAFRDRKNYDNNSSLGYSVERPSEQGERPGGRGRGGSRGRGMRGGGGFRSTDGFDQRGKREFERHSGSDRTGVRPEEKRGGSGPRNWGSMRDQMSGITDEAPAVEGEEAADAAETSTNVAPEGEGEGHAAEEATVEMSLDEWKALQQQSRPKAEFNLRKADTSVFSHMVVHKPKKHMEQAEEGEEEDLSLRRPANDITAQLKIDFGNLARPSRGTRGGGRGGRGRGGPVMRPETTSPQKPNVKARVQNQSVPNPDDPEDFPALA